MEKFDSNAIHQIDENQTNDVPVSKFVLTIFGVLIVGIFFGFLISRFTKNAKTTANGNQTNNSDVQKTAGIVDKKTFKDSVEGILKEGGIEGEGNFHLERPGGTSQNAYLTSSTVDLTPYVGKKVKVWGQTFKGQKAGWLMDVGLVEVL